MKKALFLRALALLLCLTLLCGCVPGTDENSRGKTDGVYTNGSYDDYVPDQISGAQKLSPVSGAAAQTQKKKHTVMIYMVGSDLESNGGYATADLLEMEGSGFDSKNNNLLVYVGGSKSWDANISSDKNWLLQLGGSGKFQYAASTQQSANMGNPRVLADFLNFAYENYSAEKYSLIFWDHGGGPMYYYGYDEQYKDGLYLYELKWAMEQTAFKQQPLEMVGFDACLMASLEIAATFAPYAKYFVASEEMEPGRGWDYGYLNVYNSGADISIITQRILNEYKGNLGSNTQYTLSCLDLSKLDETMAAADGLFLKMAEGCLTGDYTAIAQARDRTKRFAASSTSYELVDLGHMAKQLTGLYKNEASALLQALEELVTYRVGSVSNTSGVSIYYPYDDPATFQKYGEKMSGEFLNSQGYQLFIKAFASKWIQGRPQISWEEIKPQEPAAEVPEIAPPQEELPVEADLTQLNPEESYYTWQIDPAYLNVYSSASYTILRYDADSDTYTPVLSDPKAIIDESGTIYVPQDPYIFTLTTDRTPEAVVWPVIQAENTSQRNTYYSMSTLLASGDVVIGSTKPVELIFGESTDGKIYLERVMSRNEDAALFGKSDVELTQWSSLGALHYAYYITYDLNGNILPANQWSTDGALTVEYVPYTKWLHFQRVRISSLDGAYYLELSLTDVQGQSYNVAYQQLKAEEDYQTYTFSTEAGQLHYRVYADHVELVTFDEAYFDSWGGEAPRALSLPDQILGRPVTVIAPEVFKGSYGLGSVELNGSLQRIEQGAFRACYNLQQVKLNEKLTYIGEEAFFACPLQDVRIPDGVNGIGWRAFAATKITKVTLPAQLDYLGNGVFYGCQALTEIAVAAGNKNFVSVDGVLFSADRKTLLSYPAGKGSSYAVPAGTEVIAAEAFRDCSGLTAVSFPESLLKIEALAFCDTLNLKAICLPDSLQSIGSAAFGKSLAAVKTQKLAEIQLGKNLTWIGEAAFDGYDFAGFSVAKGNTAFSADGGYLMNSSGSRLIRVATLLQGVANIPQTVNHIEAGAFTECTGITEIYLPDSVTSIAEFADIPVTVRRLTIGKGLQNWNNLKYCASIASLGIPEANPYFKAVDGNLYNSDVTQLLLFRSKAETCALPDTVTTIVSGAFRGGKELPLKWLTLPAGLSSMPDGVFGLCANLQGITVATGNKDYTSYDGLLYNGDGTTLICLPMGKTGTVQIRQGTLEIARGAIYDSSLLQAEKICFPEGLLTIRDSNLMSRGESVSLTVELPASLQDIHSDFLRYYRNGDVQVLCPAGSYGEKYAQNKGLI